MSLLLAFAQCLTRSLHKQECSTAMEGGLMAFCIACAKFSAGDGLGQALAVAATAPYFVIYHCAVLVHARR